VRFPKPTPALLISLLALFVALGGTTYAVQRLPKRSVGSAQLRVDAVRNKNIKAGAVSRSKIRAKAVTATQVGTDSLLGRNILESSLGKVPDSDKLDGEDASRFLHGTGLERATLNDGQSQELFKLGPLVLRARCAIDSTGSPGSDVARVEISSTQPGAFDTGGPGQSLAAGVPEDLLVTSNGGGSGPAFGGTGSGHVLLADGTEVSALSLYAGVNLQGLAGRCTFGGTVIG
jgi:hypothetical protein